jgi:hypothetical protein
MSRTIQITFSKYAQNQRFHRQSQTSENQYQREKCKRYMYLMLIMTFSETTNETSVDEAR